MPDVLAEVLRHNAGRDPERLAMKYARIRQNPFVFMRGTCHLFHQQLPDHKAFVKAPPAWACGDLHLENFGSYKGDNRLVYFDINDFDEAVLAPATLDALRFMSSVTLAAETMQVSAKEAKALNGAFLDAYFGALAQGKARWIERDTAQGLVHDLLDGLRARQRPAFLDGRTVLKGQRRTLRVDGKKALPVTAAQRRHVVSLLDAFACTQDKPGFFDVLDVARRIAGNGSLGLERYVILVRGKGAPDGHYLLDLKAAAPSCLKPHLPLRHPKQPKWASQAHRVVALQRRMQAVSMAFLHPIVHGEQSYVLRALQPSEDRVSLSGPGIGVVQLQGVIRQMAQCLAWAQLRSSGRQGSAIADELVEWGQTQQWRKALLAGADACAQQVHADWLRYAEAYDDGAFDLAIQK
ncbi:MAG: DUF2252 family protein [Aquabacterium sp.]